MLTAPLPPQIQGFPLLGNALDLAGDVRAYLHEQHLRHGSIFRLRALQHHYTVMAGIEANHFLMKEGAAHFRSKEFWQEQDAVFSAKRSLISMDGPDHARFRKVQRGGYSRSVIEGRLPEVISLARNNLRHYANTKPVSAHYLMQRVVTNQLGLLSANFIPDDYLDDMIRFVRMTLAARVTKQRFAFTLLSPAYLKAKARAFELGRRVLQSHQHEEQDDLIGDILALHRQDLDFLPESDLLIAALGPFIAGLDTAASTLAFALYCLHRHPEVAASAKQEIDYFFEQEPSAERLKELGVTHRLLLETLRMYPIAPALTRTATKDFVFAGHAVPAGTQVIIATTVPHYLAEFFPEPETFDLSRYLPPRNEHRKAGAFAPFGLGAHTCLGTGLAEALIVLNLAILLHYYQVTFVPSNYELKLDPVPTPKPDWRFQMMLKERTLG